MAASEARSASAQPVVGSIRSQWGGEGGFQGEAPSIGMGELESTGVQEESRRSSVCSESPVLGLVPVLGIADDGVAEVAEMQADLMVAAGVRRTPHQGEPRRGVAGDGVAEFAAGDRGIGGPRHLRGTRHALRQGLADAPFRVHVSADHGEILLDRLAGFELLLAGVDGFRVLAEDDDAAGGFVKSVDRVDPAAEMLAEQIPEVLRFVGVEGRAMHKEAGRF